MKLTEGQVIDAIMFGIFMHQLALTLHGNNGERMFRAFEDLLSSTRDEAQPMVWQWFHDLTVITGDAGCCVPS